MTYPLFDTHAHLICDDWERYSPRPLRADLPTPKRIDYTVTAQALIFYNQLPYVLPLLRIIAKMYPSLPILIDPLGTACGVLPESTQTAVDGGLPQRVEDLTATARRLATEGGGGWLRVRPRSN
ncbi:MAG: hypothetical protein WDO56_26755 [Gammaproteobacteria bacterium]